MKRSKRQSIRRIALGLAVAALVGPATAQARPLEVSGSDPRAIHQTSVPSIVGAEDLAFSRNAAGSPTVVTSDGGNGYDAGLGSLGGLVLILVAAGAAAAAVHHSRKAKLSPA